MLLGWRAGLSKLNYCVSELAGKGTIKVERLKNARNIKSYAYLLTPKGIAEKARLARRFLKTRIEEYEEIRKQIRELSEELGLHGADDASIDRLLEEAEPSH